MSFYGSQRALQTSRRSGSKGDLAQYAPVAHGGGNGYGLSDSYMDGYNSYTYSKTTMGGGAGGGQGGSALGAMNQKAFILQGQCQDYLKKAEYALQSGNASGDAERYMAMAKETIEQLKSCAMDLRQMGHPNDSVSRSVEMYRDQLKGVHQAISGTMLRRSRSSRGSAGGWEDPGKSFNDAVAWIGQQKRLIQTSSWGDDPAAIEQQLLSHQKFHSSIQRSPEVDHAREELIKKKDKANLHALDQEWDNLQKMSFGRTQQLRELQEIIQDISREIMWVNDREEEELVFDWGDKNIDQYIPAKQESYSKLMSILEDKEKNLNKLKVKVDGVLKKEHPASDKIEAYMDTLQTQWSWILQITKCIDVHLKENAAYSQFFKEANETYSILQKDHETIRKKFTCDKNTSLDNLLDLLKDLEKMNEKVTENKRQVQNLVNKSKSIVKLKPRNPEERSSSTVIVKALCDFKQDQKVIYKDNEGILKDNSQRSKWQVTGPGGLDMLVPSVCLLLPPPNPLSISLANKNEQYYEAILTIWNQLYINIRSLISWQYCLIDIKRINSLTISVLSRMRPEEYRSIIKSLQTHYEEFKHTSRGSELFADEDKRSIENQYTGAQAKYDSLVVQLPAYTAQQEQIEVQQVELQRQQQQHQLQIQLQLQQQQQQHQLIIIQQQQAAAAEEEASRREEERKAEVKKMEAKKTEVKKEVVRKEPAIKKDVVKVTKTEAVKRKVQVSSSSSSSHSLSELHALRMRLEAAEGVLTQHIHICLGDNGVHDCGLKIVQLETVQRDIESVREEYLRLKERILKELEGMTDSDKAQFLRSETGVINQRLGSIENSSSAYLQRLRALRALLESMVRAEDIVKVHEVRLTEKETTSLEPGEVEDYMYTLKNIKAELDQKRDVLASMEAEMSRASHWNGQVSGPYHRCDMMLSKYSEQVGLLADRWRRIQSQIDCRLQDLESYLPQLQHYKRTSASLSEWIHTTRKKQDSLQATKIEDLQSLNDHINQQKALNSAIKEKRETVESVLRDNEACVNSIRDYESDLGSYSSGLETLLNIPIKRTMLKSPSMALTQETTVLQTRYMELLTLSGDYYKYLGEMLKNMEELKIRNTRIDLLEEELRLLKEDVQDRNDKNRSLEEAIARYQLELSQSQEQLLSVEEVKRNTALQCSATQDSLDSTHSQMADLKNQLAHLNTLIEEEKRKRRVAEEHYTQQQVEYDRVLRKRQKELEEANWAKLELEKSVTDKQREAERLRRQLAEEASRSKELQLEMSKVRSQCSVEISNLKVNYESQIHVSRTDVQRLAAQREEDTAEQQLQCERMEAERRNLEEELRRVRLSMSQSEEHRRRAEEEAHSQRSVIAEEGRRRRALEAEVEVLMRQREEESSQHREELVEVTNNLQEKSEQLAYVTHSLEEETRRRRTTEEGQAVLEQSVAQLQVKLATSSMAVARLKECDEELEKMCLQLEREGNERSRVEQNVTRLQGRIKDLQAVRDGLESQVESLRKTIQEEVTRRRRVETELEQITMTMRQYTSTITTLCHNQEQANASEKRGEEEQHRLQEELEMSLRQNKASTERLTQLSSELKSAQQQLLQEQARVKEATVRIESLFKTVEEKNRALKENSAELQKLKLLTETLTKEKRKLEEELKAIRRDKEEFLKIKRGNDEELSTQINALELQLQSSTRSSLDYQKLISELSSEREKLKLEIEKIQKQATETTALIQSTQSQYSAMVKERDALLLKLKSSDQEKDRSQKLEEELTRIKISLESDVRHKQRLQEENERVKKDFIYWKDQYESKEDLVRQYDSDKERLEWERNSLKNEIERLMSELTEIEDSYKHKLLALQKELRETTIVRKTMQTELKSLREPSTLDPSTLVFDGVRKPVTAQQLVDCGVVDKPTFNQLAKGQKTVPEVSLDKKVSLKGTGPIAGIIVQRVKGTPSIYGPHCKMSLTEAKKENLLPKDSADQLLDAQAATGHIIDPITNQKLTVEEACDQGIVNEADRQRLLAAEAAAVGYRSPGAGKPFSAFQAMKKGLIDKNRTLSLLQAQESVGGILDPILSVFLPKDTAIKRDLIDEDMSHALSQRPELYLDPETEQCVSYFSLKSRCKIEPHTGLLLLPVHEKLHPSKLVFDGVRKPVTAQQLLDCGVLDKPTFNQLVKDEKTVPEVSVDKKVSLKGTGPIAGVIAGSQGKMSLAEAKKQILLPPDCADLLLDAQAATGHIIDPRTNQKLTVEEACARGLVDRKDRDRLLAAEAAAVGYQDPSTAKPLSVFEAMKKGIIDRKTGLRLLQAQESVGGILDPVLSVFLPKDTAIKRDLIDEEMYHALTQRPELYLDPESEQGISYLSLKSRCKIEPHTGLLLLPIPEKLHPSKLVFDGVRKPVTAQQLLDCGVLDKPTFNQLVKGEKSVPEVSVDKKVSLKGTGPIAGVIAGSQGKMSLAEAKKQILLPPDCADLLLDAQAATGHIINPRTNQKLTVEEGCARGLVDRKDRDRLLAAEAAAVGYKDPNTAKPLSVFEAMKKGVIDRKTGLRLLQAQESVGGILDPVLSVFLPKDTAIKRDLIDEEMYHALTQRPELYLDPESEQCVSYFSLKRRCKIEPHTGLLLLPVHEKLDPSKLVFDGVRKPVTAQQLLDCGVLDKPTFNQLVKGEKSVPEVSVDKKVSLKGTGPIAGVIAGSQGKMSLAEAKKQILLPPDCADLLLDAQAATGHIIDPRTNQRLTVEEACARGLVEKEDRDRLIAAEAAAVGYKDPNTAKPLSVFEAMKKGVIDRKTGLRLLQAQESVGGILDPILSVFLPKDTAIKRDLIDEEMYHALTQRPELYLDPESEQGISYLSLKSRCKIEPHTGLLLLPVHEKLDPYTLIFDGVRKPVTAQQLLDCGVLDKPTFNQLVKGEKSVPEVSVDKKVSLKGTGPIAGVIAGSQGKMSLAEAKKQILLPPDIVDLLLDAQAATGHIIDPRTNKKLTVEEACARGLVDRKDRDRLLAAEAAAVGYKDPNTAKPLSVFEAMKKGVIDRKTGLRLLQAQESVGGILDPILSVFLPKDTAIKRDLIDEEMYHALSQRPELYLDPESEQGISYLSLKRRCKIEPHTGLLLLPIPEKIDPYTLVFDGVRKPVTAQQLLDCGVLDKPTFNQLVKGEKSVPEVSVDKKVSLKGTGPIAGVIAGSQGKMSLAEAKKQTLLPPDCADLLLDAQAATGHIINPRTNLKLTVEEACARGLVDRKDRDRLLAAEAAAVGYKDPNTAKPLSVFEAMKKGVIDRKTGLRLLQAQESVGGILDPVLSVFLPKDTAIKPMDRDLIDEDLYQALNQCPECYLDPDTQQVASYMSLLKKCKADPSTGLLLLPAPEKPLTVQGLRDQVFVVDLVDANLLERSDVDQLREGKLTSQDIEHRLRSYLRGSTCIAGVYDEASDKVIPIYQAMKEGLLRPGTTLELLEAQAASGFIVDPVNNLYLNVSDAYKKGLFGPEFKDKLLSAERAVTGYKLLGKDTIISLFQAIERSLVDKGHGIRLLEAQIASGGIIDPKQSHRIEVEIAYKRGYFDEEMNKILTDGVESKGFFDPNTQENLTYLELKKRCITDKKTGLIVLPIMAKQKQQHSAQKNTLRKRRVVIVDPDTNKEMTVREAYDKGLIDYETFLELSEHECEWEEISRTAPDGSLRFVIIDRKTGKQYDISELLEQGVIGQSIFNQYRSQKITLAQFADIITKMTKVKSSSSSSSSTTITRTSAGTASSSMTSSSVSSAFPSPTFSQLTTTKTTTVTGDSTTTSSRAQTSPDYLKHMSSVSITLTPPDETVTEQDPVGAIFDTDTLEKISISEALNRGLVDSITAQRLLEAQACTGGIVNPINGHRLGIQEASRQGIINEDMATRLKLAQKAYIGFEDVKNRKKMSAAEAMKDKWLPYEAGHRFMEYQFVTGGLYDPELSCRRTIQDALQMGWLDGRAAQKLQNTRHHSKNLTCPKSKLKISYKEAMDNCLVEEDTGVRMLQASSISSSGISSPYNVSSAPGSRTGSRSGSRRSSVDLGSPSSSSSSSSVTNRYSSRSYTSFTSRSTC
ncbi:desmoplakin-B [Diretmus argenteus]